MGVSKVGTMVLFQVRRSDGGLKKRNMDGIKGEGEGEVFFFSFSLSHARVTMAENGKESGDRRKSRRVSCAIGAI